MQEETQFCLYSFFSVFHGLGNSVLVLYDYYGKLSGIPDANSHIKGHLIYTFKNESGNQKTHFISENELDKPNQQ